MAMTLKKSPNSERVVPTQSLSNEGEANTDQGFGRGAWTATGVEETGCSIALPQVPSGFTRRVDPVREVLQIAREQAPFRVAVVDELLGLQHPPALLFLLEAHELLRVRVHGQHGHASLLPRRASASSMSISPRATCSMSSTRDGAGEAGARSM